MNIQTREYKSLLIAGTDWRNCRFVRISSSTSLGLKEIGAGWEAFWLDLVSLACTALQPAHVIPTSFPLSAEFPAISFLCTQNRPISSENTHFPPPMHTSSECLFQQHHFPRLPSLSSIYLLPRPSTLHQSTNSSPLCNLQFHWAKSDGETMHCLSDSYQLWSWDWRKGTVQLKSAVEQRLGALSTCGFALLVGKRCTGWTLRSR